MPNLSKLKHNVIGFTIADLANEFDITHRSIRFYEDQGLLSPKRVGKGAQTRLYSNGDRTRLRLILRGKRLGFSLSEIKEILDLLKQQNGCCLQRLSGSGPTCFGIFTSKEQAEEACRNIRKLKPEYWVRFSKL